MAMSDYEAVADKVPTPKGLIAQLQQSQSEINGLLSRIEGMRQKLRGTADTQKNAEIAPIARGVTQMSESIARTIENCHKMFTDIESIF